MLIEQTLMGDIDKVAISVDRIKSFEPLDGYYLAFSGGKDSVVLKALTLMAGVKFDAHYSVTTIDPPELVRFIRSNHPDVIWERPAKPFLSRLVEKGFPLRKQRWCCSEFKEKGGHGRFVLTGIRKAESFKRSSRKMIETCFKDLSKKYLNPIFDWSDAEVWEFIRGHNIPYCSLYDEGFKRIGCVMCPMNYWRKREAERWPGFKHSFLLAFRKLYERAKERPSFQRWKSGDEVFEWWLGKNNYREGTDQGVLFE